MGRGKKLTIEEVKKRLKKIHGDVVVLDESTYKRTMVKCKFIDKDFGEWWAIPNNVCRGSGHPNRGIINATQLNILPIDIVKLKLRKVHGDILTIDESTYVNICTKCKFTDKDFGSWFASPNNVIYNGSEHPKRANEKFKQTCLKKYGVEYASQSKEIKEKIKQTCLKKYGVECSFQSKEIKEKIKQTCLKRYGVENPSQNPEIALKQAKAQNNSFILKHWKTKEEIVCVASWEKKVVEYFNKNKINFKWQHRTFKMPNGKTFRPDCYLIGKRKPWIEIKGYFRDDAQEKWDWFHKEHPNSELWDKNKLKKMKIL